MIKSYSNPIYGVLAQLGAHNTGSVGVRGSNPLCSTIKKAENHRISQLFTFISTTPNTTLCKKRTVKTATSASSSHSHSLLFLLASCFISNCNKANARIPPCQEIISRAFCSVNKGSSQLISNSLLRCFFTKAIVFKSCPNPSNA